MIKSLKDISLNITEPEYRQDPALSYSILASYERGGFGSIDKLYDKVESPSLTFGSAVDALITGGQKEFDDNFIIADFPAIKPAEIPIVKKVFDSFKDSYTDINDIPDSGLLPIIDELGYQQNWKPETRCKVIKADCLKYYQLLYISKSKTILDQYTYNRVYACVRALKDSPQTKEYFCDNDPFNTDIVRYYQLKFKTNMDGIDYRCMMDLAIVDYKNKVIYPIDLKTSAHREYEFYKSFLQWSYQIQGRLYWRILRKLMDEDEYFKDFRLADYQFIVVNNIDNPNPLVWEFESTQALGNIEIVIKNGTKIELRDPEVIGKELRYYLDSKPIVPQEIKIKGKNSLSKWLKEAV